MSTGEISTGAAPIRASKRKLVVRAKLSYGSTSSSPGDPPSRVEVNLTELFAHPEIHARPDDPAGTTEGAASKLRSNCEIQTTPERMPSHKLEAELTSHSTPKAEERCAREDSTRPSVEDATILNPKDDATVIEKSHSRALTESDLADIGKKLRRMLQEQVPEHILVHEDLCTFVYYEEPNGKEYDCVGSSNLQDEADTGACSTSSGNGDRLHAVSGDCELQRACSSSSSSICYESVIEEQHEEEENDGVENASCQESSSAPYYSRGPQVVQETSHAEAQTEDLDTSLFVMLHSTPQSGGADVSQMKERLEKVRHNQVIEVQLLKFKQLLTRPQAATPQYVVKPKNCIATKEQKPVDKNRAGDEVSPPHPWSQLLQRNVLRRLRPENKLLMPPVEPRPWPLEHVDEQFSRVSEATATVSRCAQL
ncbi:hypothetical protein MTO96_048672 [Rhipicephalus appendiculatus]